MLDPALLFALTVLASKGMNNNIMVNVTTTAINMLSKTRAAKRTAETSVRTTKAPDNTNAIRDQADTLTEDKVSGDVGAFFGLFDTACDPQRQLKVLSSPREVAPVKSLVTSAHLLRMLRAHEKYC